MLEVKDFTESKEQMGNEFSYEEVSVEKTFLKSCIGEEFFYQIISSLVAL